MVKATLWVGALTFLVKLLAVGKDMAVAYRYGRSTELEGFLLLFALVQFLINTVPGNIPTAFIPMLAKVVSDGKESPGGFNRTILLQSTGLGMLVAVLAGMVAPGMLLSHPMAWRGAWLHPLLRTLPLLLLMLPMCAIQWTLGAILQARRDFTAVSLSSAWSVLTVAVALLFWQGPPGTILPAAYLAGAVLEVLWLVGTLLMRHGTQLSGPRPGPATLKRYWSQYYPVLFGAFFICSGNLVDMLVASRLAPGSVAALSYANRIASGLMGLAGTAMGAVALPMFSDLIAARKFDSIRATVRRLCFWILALGLPSTLLLAAASRPLAMLLFQRGAMVAKDVDAIAPLQAIYLFQLPFYFLAILLVRVISAFQKNQLLFKWTILASFLNLSLDLLLVRWFGAAGIALSSTLVVMVSCPLMWAWVHTLTRTASEGAP